MKRTIFLLVLLISMLLTGCNSKQERAMGGGVYYYTDPKTNVDYLIYSGAYRGGICPRYNADGSLFVRGD